MAFVTGGSIFYNFSIAKQLVLVFFTYKMHFTKSYSVPMGGETCFWIVSADCSLVTFLQLKQTTQVFFAATGCIYTWFNMLNFGIMYY